LHIEFDVLEVVAVIFGYFAIKWGFRGFLMVAVGKVLSTLKDKAVDSVGSLKQSFESFEGGQEDARDER
jgi:hypothetical protein